MDRQRQAQDGEIRYRGTNPNTRRVTREARRKQLYSAVQQLGTYGTQITDWTDTDTD